MVLKKIGGVFVPFRSLVQVPITRIMQIVFAFAALAAARSTRPFCKLLDRKAVPQPHFPKYNRKCGMKTSHLQSKAFSYSEHDNLGGALSPCVVCCDSTRSSNIVFPYHTHTSSLQVRQFIISEILWQMVKCVFLQSRLIGRQVGRYLPQVSRS